MIPTTGAVIDRAGGYAHVVGWISGVVHDAYLRKRLLLSQPSPPQSRNSTSVGRVGLLIDGVLAGLVELVHTCFAGTAERATGGYAAAVDAGRNILTDPRQQMEFLG